MKLAQFSPKTSQITKTAPPLDSPRLLYQLKSDDSFISISNSPYKHAWFSFILSSSSYVLIISRDITNVKSCNLVLPFKLFDRG